MPVSDQSEIMRYNSLEVVAVPRIRVRYVIVSPSLFYTGDQKNWRGTRKGLCGVIMPGKTFADFQSKWRKRHNLVLR